MLITNFEYTTPRGSFIYNEALTIDGNVCCNVVNLDTFEHHSKLIDKDTYDKISNKIHHNIFGNF